MTGVQTCALPICKLAGQWLGKSPWLQSVHFIGEAAIGDLVEVELVEAGANSLAGRLVAPAVDQNGFFKDPPTRSS